MIPVDLPHDWTIVEPVFRVAHQRRYEGLMAIGSGPLQQRASLEEGLRDDPQDREYLRITENAGVGSASPSAAGHSPPFKSRVGTYMPGVTGPHPTCRDELINLPALHGLIIYAAGERLDMEHCRIDDYCRWLDLRTGRLMRQLVWKTRGGGTVGVQFERFISAARRHVQALRCTLQHLGGRAVELRFLAPLDADVRTNGFDHFAAVEITGEHEPITLAVRTNSGIDVGSAALMMSDFGLSWTVEEHPRWAALCATATIDGGETLTLGKFAAMTSSWHVAGPPVDIARELAWDAAGAGFERLAAESDAVWARRWAKTDVQIEGDPRSQLALRVSLYHLLRAAVEDDPRVSIDGGAVTGEASGGRVSWEAEIFMLPLFLYTRPEVGQMLARFRYLSLDGARRNARRQGYAGARFAWESSPAGDENCPDALRADHAVHITADVAYGLWHAHRCRPDDSAFLAEVAQVLIETGRYWRDRLTYDGDRDEYELLMVTGPNEYAPLVRNNSYTNRLVKLALALAETAWEQLDPATAAQLRVLLRMAADEPAVFARIAERVRVPYDGSRQLMLQSDDFFAREPFDFAHWWPARDRPLAASVSQERLYRSQVLKQADGVQLLALLPQEFDLEQMRSVYDTYAPLTCHDSSVSRPVHALVAARLGRVDEAYQLWAESIEHEFGPDAAAEGLHAGAAGMNWQVVVFGFGGVSTRMESPELRITPRLPAGWTRLSFPMVWNGRSLSVTIAPGQVRVEPKGEAGHENAADMAT